MARIFLNNVRTKLTATLLAAGTSCTVTAGDGAQFADATGGDTIRATLVKVSGFKEIAWEIVDITARSTDTLTITRAQEGTTALDFAIGDVLDVRWTAESIPVEHIALQNFRLSLTTAVPVTTADVTGATTVYCTPYVGNTISLYDGVNWVAYHSAEFSLALGTLAAGKPYDVFCYANSGVPTLEFLAWTDDTNRATALVRQDGVLCKTGALTRRYLGTFYTTATTTTEDSYAKRFLWNYYNRVDRDMRATDATASWTYTTAAHRQANANAANKLDFVIGINEDTVEARTYVLAQNTSVIRVISSIGEDSTTTPAVNSQVGITPLAIVNTNWAITASYCKRLSAGRHYLAWLEFSDATGTTIWLGGTDARGIFGRIRG